MIASSSGVQGWQRPLTAWVPPLWVWLALIALALILRGLLVVGSPTSYGYVYDFYHEGVQLFHRTGSLPRSTDCWQCYHPPLFYTLGLGLYALGDSLFGGDDSALRALSALPLVCGLVVLGTCHRLMRVYGLSAGERLWGLALAACVPVLFISSYAVEADILLAAILSAFLCVLSRTYLEPGELPLRSAVALGLLAGLAAATKYSGLIALPLAGALSAVQLFRLSGKRMRVVRNGLVIATLTVAIGGWKYVDNLREHQTLLFANGTAQRSFAGAERVLYWDRYDFISLEPRALMSAVAADAPMGRLTDQSVYRSVWTTLHAQTWGDMGMFSLPTRHGSGLGLYPPRGVPDVLVGLVLGLGVGPALLALLGVAVTLRRPETLPLWLAGAATLAVYFYYCLAQPGWALKTKYLLFLLPVMIVYTIFGARWLIARLPPARWFVIVWAVALLCSASLYDAWFALGTPPPRLEPPAGNATYVVFDGSTPPLRFASNRPATDSFTYELLLQRSALARAPGAGEALNVVVIAERGRWGENRVVVHEDGRVAFIFHDGRRRPHAVVSLEPVPALQWVHVAGVWDGSGIALYVDGALQGYEPTAGRSDSEVPHYGIVGAGPGRSNAFRGAVDDIRIWDRALTQSEIQQVMGRDVEELVAIGPVVDWRFDEIGSPVVRNRGSSGSDLRAGY